MLKKNVLNYAVLSCKNHKDLDKKTIKKFIPGYKLMENAGVEIFKIIKKEFKKQNKIKILCGPGNNGGDGFVVAKLLKENGYLNVDLFCLVAKKELKGDAKLAAKSFNGKLKSFSNFKVSNDDLIIDGLFGSGLKKNISGNLKKIIKKINLKNHIVYPLIFLLESMEIQAKSKALHCSQMIQLHLLERNLATYYHQVKNIVEI